MFFLPDLVSAGDWAGIVAQSLDPHRIALGCAGGHRLASSLLDAVAADEQAAVRDADSSAASGEHADDSWRSSVTHGIGKLLQLLAVRGLLDSFAGGA
jgi:hypothetical protein